MFGRRPDGRRIRGIDPIVQITPYIMPMRCDAQVFLKHRADIESMNRFIRQQKVEKQEKLSHLHIMIAAYVRALGQNPEINRFIVNKQYFSRNNCSVALTMLKDPDDISQGETVIKPLFDLTDTIYDVRDRLDALVAANRGDQPKNFLDKLAAFLFKVPGLPTVVVALVRLLDRYGICPRALIDELPFHAGLYITNTASIGLHDVNHHIYNFGNVGMFFSIGMTERVAVVENGETRMRRFMPIGIVVDERVCSGAHYARFFNDMRRYLDHPELLVTPPESVRFDPGCEYHQPKPEKV